MSKNIWRVLVYLLPVIGGTIGLFSEYANLKDSENTIDEMMTEKFDELKKELTDSNAKESEEP